ncbi:hypothetical protein B566_EDAN010484 [Ephemera danica]|nr:hypothetical protein B566_EDAN010484 [Ephemera danica]
MLMVYWNMSQAIKSSEITAGEFEDAPVVRTWALCLKFQVLTLILRPGYNVTKLHGSLRGTKDREHFKLKFDVKVNTSVPKHSLVTPRYLHDMGHHVNTKPSVIPFVPFTGLPSDVRLKPQLLTTKPPVNFMESHISKDMEEKILALHSQLQTGKITKLGFARKKIALLNQPQVLPVRKMLAYNNPGVGDHIGFLPWERNDLESENLKFSGRKLLDTFGESLLHVNRLYNREFGFEARRVPAHMAHLIDKNIMIEVQKRTWSDREIRTLLTQLHDLPLSFSTVTNFEMQIINCSHQLPKQLYEGVSVPPYERYIDSKMPVVTRELVVQCMDVAAQLTRKFGNRKKYKYEIVGEEDVLFKMLTSNLSHVIGSLDEVRRRPKKFICLNDNMDPSREKDNIIVRAVLQDFYESILPIPSNFELPQMYRNRFLHVSELRSWRQYRSVIHSVTLVCIIFLLAFTIALICQGEGRPWYRRLYKRMRNSSRTCRV